MFTGVGYLPLSDDGGRVLFQLVNAWRERGSMTLTTKKGFAQWGSVVGDEVIAPVATLPASSLAQDQVDKSGTFKIDINT